MDEESQSESTSPSISMNGKAKRVRKGRPPKDKVKQSVSADSAQSTASATEPVVCKTDCSITTVEHFDSAVNDDTDSDTHTDTSEKNQNVYASTKEKDMVMKHKQLKVKEKIQTETGNGNGGHESHVNDNLLMPPPAQPDDMELEHYDHQPQESECSQSQEEVEEFQENELVVDGFSIYCFDSANSVEVALKATGNAYENRRLLIDQSAMVLSKSPRLPSRDSRSPTGRKGRAKTPAKSREPKTPKSGKRAKKSPLALGTSPLAAETVACSSSTPAIAKIKASGDHDIKAPEIKEEITMTLSDFEQLPNQPDSLPLLKSSKMEAASNSPQIKSEMKAEPTSHQHNQAESKPIKQENVDSLGIKAATTNTNRISNTVAAPTAPAYLLPTPLSTFNEPKFCSTESLVTNPTDLKETGLHALCKLSSIPATRVEGPRITTDLQSLRPKITTDLQGVGPRTTADLQSVGPKITADLQSVRPRISTDLQSVRPRISIDFQGSDPVPCPGSRGGSASHTTVTGSSTFDHPTPTPSLQSITTVQPPVTTRSGSVHSVTSSNSTRATPVCASSVSSTSRDRENSGSSRAASRSSDRNNSRSSQPPVTSSADPLSATVFGSPPSYTAMLSFGGPNGIAPPFNYPGAPGLPPTSGFPFGGPDLMPPFSHSSSMAAASQEAMRAEFSRRMLMQSGERSTLAPYLRSDQLFPIGSPMNNAPPLVPNIPGPMLLQMLEKNMPKMDHVQQAMFINQQRTALAAASVAGVASMGGTPVVGPSPFQSVPGGHHTSSSSPENAQKKSGKWCNAHVRIAYHIMNTRNSRRSEDAKNGIVTSSHSKADCRPLNHSISAITSNIHRPPTVTPSSVPKHHKPSPMPSPSRPLDARKQASSSPLHRSDKNRSLSSTSNPNSPARACSPPNMPKDLSISNRSLPNGALSASSPKDMRWNKTHSTPPAPSTSRSSPNAKKREQDMREKKYNGSTPQSAINPHGKRPSSTLAHSNSKKHRSRSRSPPRAAHSKPAASQRHSNGLNVDPKTLTPSSASMSAADVQQRQFFSSMLSGMMNDNKAAPANGYPPNAAVAATAMYNPYLHSREYESQRERLYSQANPAHTLANFMERQNDRAMMIEFERARANHMYNPSMSGLNGFHNSISSIPGMGGPPPLIPTSQAKVNPPSAHHTSPSHTLNTSNGAANDRYPR